MLVLWELCACLHFKWGVFHVGALSVGPRVDRYLACCCIACFQSGVCHCLFTLQFMPASRALLSRLHNGRSALWSSSIQPSTLLRNCHNSKCVLVSGCFPRKLTLIQFLVYIWPSNHKNRGVRLLVGLTSLPVYQLLVLLTFLT